MGHEDILLSEISQSQKDGCSDSIRLSTLQESNPTDRKYNNDCQGLDTKNRDLSVMQSVSEGGLLEVPKTPHDNVDIYNILEKGIKW